MKGLRGSKKGTVGQRERVAEVKKGRQKKHGLETDWSRKKGCRSKKKSGVLNYPGKRPQTVCEVYKQNVWRSRRFGVQRGDGGDEGGDRGGGGSGGECECECLRVGVRVWVLECACVRACVRGREGGREGGRDMACIVQLRSQCDGDYPICET